jgi:hypothetical protein
MDAAIGDFVQISWSPRAKARGNSLNDKGVRDEMYFSIKGQGAFRMFKHNIRRFDLEQDWYGFREAEFYRIAREWCEYNEIEYIDDERKDQ